MSIVPHLFELYRNQGISVVSGLNPPHWSGLRSAPFTWFLRDGKSCTKGLGIALQEVLFLECLFDRFKPERLFIIGNSFGRSTVALALLNPQSRIVAMDACVDRNSLDGLKLTNDIARKADLNVEAVRGFSPQDVESVLAEHFDAPHDFVFIDGLHTNEQVVLDFRAVRAAAPMCSIFLFHDVHEFELHRGLADIAAESGWTAPISALTSPSGCSTPALANTSSQYC
jgi:Methyltransferase domain